MYHEYIFTWYKFSQIRVKLIKKYYSFFLQPTYLQANKLISFYRYLQLLISQVALSFLNIFEEFFSGCTLQQFKLSFCDVGFSRSSITKYFVFIIVFLILSCCDRFTKICRLKIWFVYVYKLNKALPDYFASFSTKRYQIPLSYFMWFEIQNSKTFTKMSNLLTHCLQNVVEFRERKIFRYPICKIFSIGKQCSCVVTHPWIQDVDHNIYLGELPFRVTAL